MSQVEALEALGFEVVASAVDGDYQGEEYVALKSRDWVTKSEQTYGFVSIGFGSCSGCDAWQAADSIEERLAIVQGEVESIKWFETLDELKAFVADTSKARENWYGHDEGWPSFVKAVQELT